MKSKIKKNCIALAGVLAALCVASYVPVNVGIGGIFSDASITASAEDVQITNNDLNEGLVIDAGTTIKFFIRTNDGRYLPFKLQIYLDGTPVKEVDSVEYLETDPDRYYTTTNKCIVDSYENDGYTIHTLYLKSLHTVTWKNEDGTVLKTEDVEKGETPSYGSEPTKTEDDQYTYTFAGWTDGTNTYGVNDTLPGVTADVTYAAVFDKINKYATATCAQIGEDYQPQFNGDTAASLWNVTVKAGDESIEKIDVKLGTITSQEGAHTLETPITTNAQIVLGVVTNLTGAEVNEMGGFTVMVNGEAL